ARFGHAAVWTGLVMLVWGGDSSLDFPRSPLGDGAAYDPSTDTWHPVATSNAPPACGGHTALWTGSTVLVWGCTGGGEYDPVADTGLPSPAAAALMVSSTSGGTEIDSFRAVMQPV
ncbi:MAG: hypothetical protein ACM3ML_08195, partial [Micromonosporaceae bacterium]